MTDYMLLVIFAFVFFFVGWLVRDLLGKEAEEKLQEEYFGLGKIKKKKR